MRNLCLEVNVVRCQNRVVNQTTEGPKILTSHLSQLLLELQKNRKHSGRYCWVHRVLFSIAFIKNLTAFALVFSTKATMGKFLVALRQHFIFQAMLMSRNHVACSRSKKVTSVLDLSLERNQQKLVASLIARRPLSYESKLSKLPHPYILPNQVIHCFPVEVLDHVMAAITMMSIW